MDLRRNRKAATFFQYAMVLGVVSLAFAQMNYYIKTSIQGKVKGVNDYFLGAPPEPKQGQGQAQSQDVCSATTTLTKEHTVTTSLGGGTRVDQLVHTKDTPNASETIFGEPQDTLDFDTNSQDDMLIPSLNNF